MKLKTSNTRQPTSNIQWRREFPHNWMLDVGCSVLDGLPRLSLVCLVLIACFTSPIHLAAQPASRPNVLFISIDDLRTNLGCYGDPIAVTPNIDRLAESGLLFQRAYCQQAVCNPSRQSLMAGRRPDSIRVWNMVDHFRQTAPDVVTLPEHFKQHGYFAQSFGKIYHGQEGMNDPQSWSVPEQFGHADKIEDYGERLDPREPKGNTAKRQAARVAGTDDDYPDGKVAKAAVEALRRFQADDTPFFLAVGFRKPHLPFSAPKKYWDLYDRAKIPLPSPIEPPADGPAIALHDWVELRGYSDIPKEGPLLPEKTQELRHGYYAATSFSDAQAGKVLDELERLGLHKNTVVILWSDHGFHLGERALWAKTSNYELDARVPLIVRVPERVTAGEKTDALVELLDIYPTLVDLCGLPMPGKLDGLSFAPLLTNPNQPWKPAAFTQFPRPWRMKGQPENMGYSIRTEKFRYTEWINFRTRAVLARELYGLSQSLDETVNLADDPKYAGEVARHSRLLAGTEPLDDTRSVGGPPGVSRGGETPPEPAAGDASATGRRDASAPRIVAPVAFEGRVVKSDVCIYGGTSGGVVAAVQASRMGRTVVIVEPGRHLGGMTAGGLSWTDVGNRDRIRAIGGMAREVYERIGARYGQDPETVFDTPATNDPTRTGYDFAKPPSLSFEPKVAEAVFVSMTREAGVPVHFEQRLKTVRTHDRRIQEIVTEDGAVFRAKIFLDATYEGDLMAAARVSSTIGREANAHYGESVNGIQGPATSARAGRFEVAVDPYFVPGDPSSGILPYLLHAGDLGEIGSADSRVQSYNYRVCLTDNPTNRIPIAPPADYDPRNFELLARWIEARINAGQKLTLRDFLKYDPLQNGKYDFNNRWPISTDFIGGAHHYPEADAAGRERIAREHENYLRGFLHFLATHPRVPEAVRVEMGRFGLCRDEFADNGGWPHQLYVREARRMVSDFVMVEQHVVGERVAPNSIGLGAYGIDMHAVRRIVHEGRAVNEGTIGRSVPRPYPIAYGAIVPKAAECENLFVTFALSASHVAFGSIRMEPVFMTVSQSAAIAASLAIDDNVSVQEVNYGRLRTQLLASKQVLE